MQDLQPRRKRLLFVDDDPAFLAAMQQVFSELARGSWEILTAANHAQALAVLREQRLDLVVLDLSMPVMDGLQFLRLIARTHPGQQVVIWTGRASEENRRVCQESGAALVLEKVITSDGFSAVFSALDALAGAAPQEGFRGVMRRVGLEEVLQLECLGRKSSILEVFTQNARGRIFIHDGSIIHAECGSLQGEVGLYALLGLKGGDFNFLAFTEPAQRTISGQYEFLLMEAARLRDEGASPLPGTPEAAPAREAEPETAPPPLLWPPPDQVGIAETLLCSGAGEVLYERDCASVEARVNLLARAEEEALELASLLRAGRFERLELLTPDGRIVCVIQPHLRLLVRSRPVEPAAA